MEDAIFASALPSWAQAVAGYTSGNWPSYLPIVARFPHAYHVSIAVNAFQSANCLDIEPGDAVPSEAVGWVHTQWYLGNTRPCLYSSLSEMSSVRADLAGAGIIRSRVRLWDADWTYVPHLDAGYDATQWTDHGPNGENFDESTVALSFFGVTPPKPPTCEQTRAKQIKAWNGQLAGARMLLFGLSREQSHNTVQLKALRALTIPRNLTTLFTEQKREERADSGNIAGAQALATKTVKQRDALKRDLAQKDWCKH
jgi:hypothetical protein